MSVNKVMVVGRLGRDPEVKSTPSGTTLAKFSVATDEKFTDREGNRQERTEWHNIIVWGKLADICGQYLRKGKLVYIEGSLRTDSWDDKESGKKMYRTEIVASNMQMLGPRGEDEGGPRGGGNYGGGGGGSRQPGRDSSGGSDFGGDPDDEIPF